MSLGVPFGSRTSRRLTRREELLMQGGVAKATLETIVAHIADVHLALGNLLLAGDVPLEALIERLVQVDLEADDKQDGRDRSDSLNPCLVETDSEGKKDLHEDDRHQQTVDDYAPKSAA